MGYLSVEVGGLRPLPFSSDSAIVSLTLSMIARNPRPSTRMNRVNGKGRDPNAPLFASYLDGGWAGGPHSPIVCQPLPL